jgi:plasmid stabilization system protein ParE
VSRAFRIRLSAQRDLEEAREWYDIQEPGVGREFADETGTVLARVRDNPELYAAGRRGVRQALVNRFPYVVYYRILGDTVEVFAVVHTSRHPRAWRSRL